MLLALFDEVGRGYEPRTQANHPPVYANCPRPAFVFDGRLMLDRKKLQKIGFTVVTIGTGDRV